MKASIVARSVHGMDSLSLAPLLDALVERCRGRKVQAVWRSHRTDLYISFGEDEGLYFSFADPVGVCVQGYPRKLHRTSDPEATEAGHSFSGCALVDVRHVRGERVFELRFEGGEEPPTRRDLLISLVPGRAGFMIRRGDEVSGRESLRQLFADERADETTPLLDALAVANAGRAEALVVENRHRLPPLFRSEIIVACSEPTALHRLQQSILEYLAGHCRPTVHRVPSDLPEFLRRVYLSPFPFATLGEARELPDILRAASYYVGLSRGIARDAALMTRLRQHAAAESRRLDSIDEGLSGDQEKAHKAQEYQSYAQALLSAPPDARRSPVEACWYDEAGRHDIQVPLLAGLDARASSQRYFDMAKKSRRAAEYIASRRTVIASRRAALAGLRAALDAVSTHDELLDLAHRFPSVPVAPASGRAPKREKKRVCAEFECTDGTILVGRSAAENMAITFKEARPGDLWLHAHDVAGSHVVVRLSPGIREPSRETLLRAASLAARFSRARSDSLVEVCYTQRKFVRKIKGGVLGQVRLERFKTILVAPAGDADG